MDPKIVQAVADRMPRINRFVAEDYAKQTMDSSIAFIDTAFSDAVRWGRNLIEYQKWEVLSPEERVRWEFEEAAKKNKLSLAVSERVLVRFDFVFEKHKESAYLYVLYVHDGTLVIRGKRYAIHLGISERVFARVHNKDKDGIIVRPIRARLEFNRKVKVRYPSVTSNEIVSDFVVTTVLHHKPSKKRACDTTVLLYLLCKFGFWAVMKRVGGLTEKDIGFRDYPDMTKADDYDYFVACKKSKDPNVHLYVRRDLLEQPHVKRIVTNLLYTLTYFDFQTIDDLYDPQGKFWRIVLGVILYKPLLHAKAKADADTHISSVDTFIDPISRERFKAFGVNVDDIYQLLYYVLFEIDRIMVNSATNDLYTKRIDIVDGILIASYATSIFRRFYKTNQRPTLQLREVKAALKINPMAIEEAFSSRRGWSQSMQNISPSPQIFGDNQYLSCAMFKLRPSARPMERAHPSVATVECIVAYAGNQVNINGIWNPYITVDPATGAILRPPQADELDPLKKFLPAS